jgi:hypothetical protein
MPLLDENPWETVYVHPDPDLREATSIMEVLVRVSWWTPPGAAMTTTFVPINRKQFYEQFQVSTKR